MRFITLLTDFGERDGYTGIMKGVIYRIAPDVQITDITHQIQPQNIRAGSLAWKRSYAFFPERTVHVAVVDPGVGTRRRPVAARIGAYTFVYPDNGLITPILREAEQNGTAAAFFHLDQPRFWLPQISSVFHGRDIFAPAAAHIANGVALEEMGTRIDDPVLLDFPQPIALENGWRCEVIDIDHFGNLGTNLDQQCLQSMPRINEVRVHIAGKEIQGISHTFGDRPPGELVTMIDSDGNLAIATVNGNASRALGAGIGTTVEVIVGG